MKDAATWIAERWAERLAAAIESMTGQRPACALKEESAPGEDVLWWRQKVEPAEGSALWVAAGEDCWRALGSWILHSAGIEAAESVDARNTWIEVLSQTANAVVGDIGRRVSSRVFCGDADVDERPPEDAIALELELNVSDSPCPAWVAFSPALVKTLHPEPAPQQAASPCEPSPEQPSEVRPPKGLDLLLDIDLPVSVSFGRAQLPLKDVLKLTTGAIVELNRTINDPVEVIVNNRIIARGEVVVIEGNYGVRIHEIVSRESRMGSLR